jgi:hypothetical protein
MLAEVRQTVDGGSEALNEEDPPAIMAEIPVFAEQEPVIAPACANRLQKLSSRLTRIARPSPGGTNIKKLEGRLGI